MQGQKPSVLACVTGQFDCDRIIEAAAETALENDCELRVISVIDPAGDYGRFADEIQYLDSVAKAFSADLTLMFHNDAARITAQFVGENNISHIVTGMHDGGDRSFLVRFNELAPSVSISMVDKDHNVYTMSARVAARI